MASVPLPFLSTKETTNYARLCRLLVDVGSQALRDTFDKIHPPTTLHTVLSSHSVHYATLQSLYRGRRKVLNPTQWGKLYPVHSRVTSASFDITLLTVLLRNICGLIPPATGWDSLPPAADTSIADDIARVKHYRNTVYGHASQASVDDTSFNAYWSEIRDALVRLGGASFRLYIDSLEHDCMDPDIEEHYCALIKQWKKDDDSIKDKLELMEESIRQMRGEMKTNMKEMKDKLDTLTATAEEKRDGGMEKMKSEIENISDKLGTLTAQREANETKDEESIRDSLEQMRSEVENNMVEMKERLNTLAATAEEKRQEGIFRDDLEKMRSEMANISDKLGSLTAPREAKETEDEENIKDKLEQIKSEMVDMKEKWENLTIPRGESEEKGAFDPAELIDGIRQLYKSREGRLSPFPWCEEFHFNLNDIYTRLKMVSRKKTRGIATADIVNMSAIFNPHDECQQPRTVLIEGKPGMGKTTYCKKVVYDWATGKQREEHCFPRFEIVLLLKCRDIKSDLWKAIDDQLLPRDIQEDVREKFFQFIRHNQSNVLLILDGLDELPAKKLPEFCEIIQGRVLPKCHIVATARHEAGINVRKYCDTLLEIKGFTEEDVKTFIFKYFKTMKTDLAEKLLSKLRNDKTLQDMAANPLNTALLCLLCEEFQGIFPESRTQLYLEIVQCVLRIYRKKKGLPNTSEDLTKVYKPQLKHLGWIALKGLCEGNLDFEESELGNHTKDLPGFGFLSLQPGGSKLRPCQHYAFLHKSFQEYFAAYYICCQLLSKEISHESLVSDLRYFNELKQVLLFTCGILAAQCEESAAVHIMSMIAQLNNDNNPDSLDVVLECITECKREQSNVHVTLARFFGLFVKFENISFDNRALGVAGATSLAEAIKVNTTLTQLDLSRNNIGAAGAASLAEAIKINTTLTQLNLEKNNIGAAGATSLAEAIKVNTTLTQLSLHKNNIGAGGVASLAEAIRVNTTLTQLNLGANEIYDVGAAYLAEAIKVNTTLTQLDLSWNNTGADGAAYLAEAIKVNTTLTQLYLRENNICDAGAASLAEAIIGNTTLTKLYLETNTIGDAGATSLADAMKVSATLTQLNLWENVIGAAGAASIAEAIKVNSTLTELNLQENSIGDAGAASLAEAIKVNSKLTHLNLTWNYIGAAGAASLAEAIKVNTTLTQLKLGANNIGDAGAASLAEAIKVNTTLTQLDLSGNKIGDAGFASFIEATKVNTALAQLNLSWDYNFAGDLFSYLLAGLGIKLE